MDYKEFAKWVSKELKLNLPSYKEEQIERRLKGYFTRNKINSYIELKESLVRNPTKQKEFLEFITINVTEFFRNPELFDEFKDVIKKDLTKIGKPLKVWSAACSNGSEPYTIAMILKEISPSIKHDILATDIDLSILDKAKSGEYSLSEIKTVKPEYINKYFKKIDSNYKIDSSISLMVRFKRHDLIQDSYEDKFDVIVCRNVVIYFKNETKDLIFKKFSQSLKPGGLLFIGATESIYNYKEFGLEKVTTFIYRKV